MKRRLWSLRIEKIYSKLLSLLLLVVGINSFSHAQEETIVSIEGVRFYCDGCLILDKELCAIPQASNSLVMKCDKVFDYLLHANRRMHPSLPTSPELIDYLKRETPHNERVIEILRTIAMRKQYEAIPSRELISLATRFPKAFEKLISEGWGDNKTIQRLWGLLKGNNKLELLGIKGIVIARVQDLSLSEVFKELSANEEREQAMSLLAIAATYAPEFKSPKSEEIIQINSLINSCSQLQLESLKTCALTNRFSEIIGLREFITPMYLGLVKTLLSNKEVSINQKNALLSSIPFHLLNETDLHDISEIVVPEFIRNADKLTQADLEESGLAELLAMSGQSSAKLLTQVKYLLKAVNKSSQRANLKRETASKVVSATLYANKKSSFSSIVWSILFFVLVAGLLGYAYDRWKKDISKVREYAKMNEQSFEELREKSELEEIFKFFGLPSNSSSEELQKAYRQLARAHHPDMAEADTEKFIELQEHYEKARKLIGNG